MNVDHPRRIRSFVRRPGRITTGQQRALDQLMPRWGIGYDETLLDLDGAFGRSAPRVLDIGFGDGEALLTAAARYPAIDYLGVEVHEPGIGHLLALIERADITNIRVIARDAVDVIAAMLSDRSFDAVNLFFPDPWPKKRHHKRRILAPAFVSSVWRILKPAGLLHFATDWSDYAEHAERVIEESELFGPDYSPDPTLAFRAPTKFERRGKQLGHDVVDLCFLKVS